MAAAEQQRVDEKTMQTKVKSVGSGFVRYPPQRPFAQQQAQQPLSVVDNASDPWDMPSGPPPSQPPQPASRPPPTQARPPAGAPTPQPAAPAPQASRAQQPRFDPMHQPGEERKQAGEAHEQQCSKSKAQKRRERHRRKKRENMPEM